ncbi:hypothetical protein BH18GEM1_BH18GEM1_04530 [soil metagenome]
MTKEQIVTGRIMQVAAVGGGTVEEAAAKTTIKLVFPLVLFIFPAMLVVILAPAILNIMKTMGGLT